MSFALEATATSSRARAGTLHTEHGAIATPVFMPVGTRATVRTQSFAQLEQLAAPMLLANTYHLMRRPGAESLARFGGLHRWVGWRGGLLTDSGGFQVFSLAGGATTEEGAVLDDELLSPERSIAVQRAIGADVMMAMDVCIPSTSPLAHAKAAMERTHRWAKRSLAARHETEGPAQALFAIVQGACFPELRRQSAGELVSIDGFDGYAIGGLAVGETRAEREDITELTAAQLPADKPRYLMGVGTPLDILEGVHRGVDMFDCILPTAWAQHGKAFTSRGLVDLRRGAHKSSEERLDPACDCEACTRAPRSYLHHLVKCEEPLAWQLLATHNLRFYLQLMRDIRAHIAADTFARYHAERRETLALAEDDGARGKRPRMKPRPPRSRGAFSVHESPEGFASIQHAPSGEIMHSVNHPDREAEGVYVAQSRALARCLAGERPLVVWDVGLGAGHNAMALVRALDAQPGHGGIELVSFERDLDAFHLALENGKLFPHLRHAAPHVLAASGRFARTGLTWRVCEGDFAETFARESAPDVVFYDPFSSKVDAPLWSLELFRRLRAHLARPAEMFTYSASTAVRSTLLAAGFFVARGVASGPKDETTIALTDRDTSRGYDLLGGEWLARRARSSASFPADIEHAVVHHAQFVQVLS